MFMGLRRVPVSEVGEGARVKGPRITGFPDRNIYGEYVGT